MQNVERNARSWTWSGCVLVLTLGLAGQAAASPGRLYAERAAMMVADGRCHLFEPTLSSALAMGAYQARNTALRGGIGRTELNALTELARTRGGAISCRDPVLLKEANRVRDAFSSFAGLYKMSFPGAAGGWRADRTVVSSRIGEGRWALPAAPAWASAPGSRFGLAARAGETYLMASTAGAAPASVRLVLRDLAKAPDPYLTGNLAPAPAAFNRTIFASDRIPAPDGEAGFRFTDAAIDAISMLDPREVVEVDFVQSTRTGDQIQRAVYEVGDFAAAVSFLRLRR